MNTIQVKPAPATSLAAARVLRSDTGVSLLDSAGNVPAAGMPWPNGGLTLRLLAGGVILRADDPAFTVVAEQPPSLPPAAPGTAEPAIAAGPDAATPTSPELAK